MLRAVSLKSARLAIVVAAFLVLAGCSSPKEALPPSPSASETQTTTSSDPPILVPTPGGNETSIPRTLLVGPCTSWSVSGPTPPAPLRPSRPPNGWDERADPQGSFDLVAYTCERISVGPFERGPVHLLLEGHPNADFPEACEEDQVESPTLYHVVHLMGLDDPELVAYLNETYDLPTWLIEV